MGFRTAFIRAAVVGLATLSCATSARAQPDIASLLRSRDPRLEAWGAWYAGAGGLRQLGPLIQDVVRAQVGRPVAMNATLDIALDAIIQLRVPLDPDLLADVYAVRPAQALIAASFAEDPDDLLDLVLRSSKGPEWFAAANLLLDRNPQRLAAHALSGLRLRLTIFVVDAGTGVASGGGGAGIGCGVEGLAPGMPPWATYSLTSFPAAGLSILALGPKPIYYRRTVAPAGQSPAGSVVDIGKPSGSDRLEYAAAAAGLPPAQMPLRGDEQHSITLPEGRSLAIEVARLRDDLERRYRLLLRMLVQRRILADSDLRTYPAAIDVEVSDHRTR